MALLLGLNESSDMALPVRNLPKSYGRWPISRTFLSTEYGWRKNAADNPYDYLERHLLSEKNSSSNQSPLIVVRISESQLFQVFVGHWLPHSGLWDSFYQKSATKQEEHHDGQKPDQLLFWRGLPAHEQGEQAVRDSEIPWGFHSAIKLRN